MCKEKLTTTFLQEKITMTRFEDAMAEADKLETMAVNEYAAKDFDMATLHHHASQGFFQRAMNMTVEQAMEDGYCF